MRSACSRPGSQLYLSSLSIYIHRTTAVLSFRFFNFNFSCFPFCSLIFFPLSFISRFKIHYFFILFTILDPFDTPSEQPTIIQNVVSSELRWKGGRRAGTHTYTRSNALDTWLCDMAGLPWDSFKAQWHKFMIAAPHFLPKLSCCCSTEWRGEDRGRVYCGIHEHDGEERADSLPSFWSLLWKTHFSQIVPILPLDIFFYIIHDFV